jgi:uncharacterized protein (TIGR03067 family)
MFTQTVLTLALVVAAPTLKEKDKEKASKIPIGEWEVTEFTQNGMDLVQLLGKITIKIDEKSLTMIVMGKDHTVDVEWDVSKTPAVMTEKKMNMKGIFKVEKDVLTFCLNDTPGGETPTEFTSGKGSKLSLMVLKKITKKD